MKLNVIATIGVVLISGPLSAEGLLKNIQKGFEKTGETIQSGAEAVGNTVSKGADIVGDTVDSTVDLATNESSPAETRAKLDAMANSVLARLLSENDAARDLFEQTAGYAIFDSRNLTIFPVAAGFGRGVAIDRDTGQRTYMNMGTGGVGMAAGIGGFATQFVIFFDTGADLQHFIEYGYDATAEGGGKSGDEGSQESARFVDGRTFFALNKKGWRVNASATGTKYWIAPDLN